MRYRLWLGSAVGLVVAAMSWRGNQTPGLVSIFPDLLALVVLAVLLAAAVRFDARRGLAYKRSPSLQAALIIAAVAGLVFGSAIVLLGVVRFSGPSGTLLAAGFLTAFGSAMICGAVARFVLYR